VLEGEEGKKRSVQALGEKEKQRRRRVVGELRTHSDSIRSDCVLEKSDGMNDGAHDGFGSLMDHSTISVPCWSL